ncbi:RHS repeat domain-containing protein [Lysobacter sp. Hz 25]|uniref:RHS repeat protein n=1 Tax=Lysobacter sp. Hz 25 TaxID=3383698 RepID=UPI0038D38413
MRIRSHPKPRLLNAWDKVLLYWESVDRQSRPVRAQKGDSMKGSIERRAACVLAAAVVTAMGTAHARTPVAPLEEYSKRVRSAEMVSPLQSDLMGESVSLYNGSTEFVATDIDLPGNNALPVRLGRRFKVESRKETEVLGGFGAWDIDVPYMYGVFPAGSKWNVSGTGTTQRCSQVWYPDVGAPFSTADIWSGTYMHIPGGGDTEMLLLLANTVVPNDGATYKWGSRSDHRFRCKPNTSNGYPGEGFIAVDTQGNRYTFDVGIERGAPVVSKYGSEDGSAMIGRVKVFLMASRVEDRHGNWVAYNYSGDQLASITSSDGRSIQLGYTDGRVSSATADGRQWTYEYATQTIGDYYPKKLLSRVVQPDGSSWQYRIYGENGTISNALLLPQYQGLDANLRCAQPLEPVDMLGVQITHPSGALGTFRFNFMRHLKNGTPANACVFDHRDNMGNEYYSLGIPEYFDNYSLATKTIAGPGLPAMQWTYEYEVPQEFGRVNQIPCTSCRDWKRVWVTQPDGSIQEQKYGALWLVNDGRLLGTTIKKPDGTVLRTQTSEYVSESEISSMPFPDIYGVLTGSDDSSSVRIRPIRRNTIVQDGVEFSSYVNQFDSFARPITERKWSSLGPSKVQATAYHDNLTSWTLGQVRSTSIDGVLSEETLYHSTTALPTEIRSFGKTIQTLVYNPDATLESVADGLNQRTSFSNWKRGVPQNISYPGGTSQSAVVNDRGWIGSVTDENGFATNYSYDAMGRLASIAYPTGDSTAWNPVSLSFQQIGFDEHGLPAGHWRSSRIEGNKHVNMYMDALWRPVLEEQLDLGDIAGSLSQVVKRYDSSGRLNFQSYPLRNVGNFGDVAQGTRTFYDALDRVTRVEQDSELGVLATTTEYLTGFQRRITDPRQKVSTQRFQVFDQPSYDAPLGIDSPAGVSTTINRDIFGKPLEMIRSGPEG